MKNLIELNLEFDLSFSFYYSTCLYLSIQISTYFDNNSTVYVGYKANKDIFRKLDIRLAV